MNAQMTINNDSSQISNLNVGFVRCFLENATIVRRSEIELNNGGINGEYYLQIRDSLIRMGKAKGEIYPYEYLPFKSFGIEKKDVIRIINYILNKPYHPYKFLRLIENIIYNNMKDQPVQQYRLPSCQKQQEKNKPESIIKNENDLDALDPIAISISTVQAEKMTRQPGEEALLLNTDDR